jgi:7-cyano-7-deazaguanine synthase in queuosine biosynthesis
MIDSSSLLRVYSLENGPKRHRIVGSETKPFETVFDNSKEFEDLMLCLHLIERYLPRETGLCFGTRWPGVWQEKKERVEQLFEFLTHRKLSIRFEEKSGEMSASQERIAEVSTERGREHIVCLFSGGLDSAAGALELVRKGIAPTLSHTATGNIVMGKATELVKNTVLKTLPMVVTDVRKGDVESSGFGSFNSRGLLFISNALIIASCLRSSEVCIAENGPLMINPNVSLRSEPTKNAHPFLITVLEEVFNHVTGLRKRINPIFKDETKAEIAAKVMNDQIIDKTWSCFNVQRQSKMCGACFACVVRRLSLLAAGYQEPQDTYEFDPFASELSESTGSFGWKLDTLHDTFIYLKDFLDTKSLQRNEMFLVPEGFFTNERE